MWQLFSVCDRDVLCCSCHLWWLQAKFHKWYDTPEGNWRKNRDICLILGLWNWPWWKTTSCLIQATSNPSSICWAGIIRKSVAKHITHRQMLISPNSSDSCGKRRKGKHCSRGGWHWSPYFIVLLYRNKCWRIIFSAWAKGKFHKTTSGTWKFWRRSGAKTCATRFSSFMQSLDVILLLAFTGLERGPFWRNSVRAITFAIKLKCSVMHLH